MAAGAAKGRWTMPTTTTRNRKPARARGGARVPDLLDRLMAIQAGPHRVVTCYLKLEPRDRGRNKYLIKLKNRVRAVADRLGRDGAGRRAGEAVRADLNRVVDFLGSPGGLPSTRGVVIFACAPLGLWEVVPVPRVYRSRLAVDATPLVRELAALEDEVGRLLAVVLDRTAARFFEVTAFDVRELPGLRADATRGGRFRGDQDGPGWGEHAYNNRIRTERARHLDLIARRLFELDREHRATAVVAAGTGPEASGLAPFLHPYLADRYLGEARLNPKLASPAEVKDAVLEAREVWERRQERERVQELAEAVGKRMAVTGLPGTLRALGRGQVRTLMVDPDATMSGFRAADTGRLALEARELRGEGAVTPVVDLVDEAIEDALRQHAAVEVVYDDAARPAVEGLAAFLRFR